MQISACATAGAFMCVCPVKNQKKQLGKCRDGIRVLLWLNRVNANTYYTNSLSGDFNTCYFIYNIYNL